MRSFLRNSRGDIFGILFVSFLLVTPRGNAQWTSCNAPLGGDVTCVDTFANYLWASLQDGGVYRSSNNGQSWESVNNGLHTNFYSGVLALMHIPGKIFAATKNGLYASANLGAHWDSIALGQTVYSLAQQGVYLYATEYGAVARSADNGLTWQFLTSGLPPLNSYIPYRLVSVQGTLILSTLGNGMYRSVDNGNNWATTANPGSIPSSSFPALLRVIGNRVFVFFSGHGFYYSDDAGISWQNTLSTGSAFLNATDITVSDGKYLVTSTSGLWQLPVSGTGAWTSVVSNLSLPYPVMENIFKSSSALYIGTADGVLSIDTSLSNGFQLLRDSMVGTNVYFLTGYNNRVLAHVHYQKKVWSSVNSGISWTTDSLTNYSYNSLTSSAVSNNKWYIGMSGGGANVSANSGQSWTLIQDSLLAHPIFSLLATTTGDVYAGTDSGRIYKLASNNTWLFYAKPFGNDDEIHSLLQMGNYWFAAIWSIDTPHVYRSSDNGMSWQIISSGWNVATEKADGMVIRGNQLFAASDGYGVFVSTDTGATWGQLSSGLPQSAAFGDVKVLNNNIYAVSSNYEQLYSLAAGNTTWVCENCQLSDPQRAVSVWASDSVLYLGTANKGVWKKALTQPVSVKNLPFRNIFVNCYPNPGAAVTLSIDDADNSAPFTINIYNAQGKLCTQSKTSNNVYRINAPLLSNGVYFIEVMDKNGNRGFVKWYKQG